MAIFILNDKNMYQPLHSYVLIKPLAKEEKAKGGIILPDTVDKEKPETGEVIAVGEGQVLESGAKKAMSVKVGDKVIFKKYSPDEVPGEKDLFLIREDDILAIIK